MQLFDARPRRVQKTAAGTIESLIVGRSRDDDSDGDTITEVVFAVAEAI
jgi:hypothetical protein